MQQSRNPILEGHTRKLDGHQEKENRLRGTHEKKQDPSIMTIILSILSFAKANYHRIGGNFRLVGT